MRACFLLIVFSYCRYLYCWRHLYWWSKLGTHPSILGVHLVCMYHHTTRVSLTFTYALSQCLCCSLCFTGRKQTEIIVIYYLPITWESGLWWLVRDYVRCLWQSRNWTNIIHSSCLLCNNYTSLSLLKSLQFVSIKNIQAIFNVKKVTVVSSRVKIRSLGHSNVYIFQKMEINTSVRCICRNSHL